MKTAYIALSLTHVKTEKDKEEIRSLLRWFAQTFPSVTLLRWAFDVEEWKPMPVPNIYDYDSNLVLDADLVVFLYLTSEGSDGRGGEVVLRALSGKPMVAFKKRGVKVSRFPADCLKTAGVDIFEFSKISDLGRVIRSALVRIGEGEFVDA